MACYTCLQMFRYQKEVPEWELKHSVKSNKVQTEILSFIFARTKHVECYLNVCIWKEQTSIVFVAFCKVNQYIFLVLFSLIVWGEKHIFPSLFEQNWNRKVLPELSGAESTFLLPG